MVPASQAKAPLPGMVLRLVSTKVEASMRADLCRRLFVALVELAWVSLHAVPMSARQAHPHDKTPAFVCSSPT